MECKNCHHYNPITCCDNDINDETYLHLVNGVLMCDACYLRKNDLWYQYTKNAHSICHYDLMKISDPEDVKRCGWNHLDVRYSFFQICTILGDKKLLKIVKTYDLSTIRTIDLSGWDSDPARGCMGYGGIEDFMYELCSNPTLTNLFCVNLTKTTITNGLLDLLKLIKCKVIISEKGATHL